MNREKFVYKIEVLSARELHFCLNPENYSLRWKVLPEGEQGRSVGINTRAEALGFMELHARRLGFTVAQLNSNISPLEKSCN